MVKCFLVEEKDASSNLAWFVWKGKVAIGKARYLLNIMIIHLDVQFVSFPYYNITFLLNNLSPKLIYISYK